MGEALCGKLTRDFRVVATLSDHPAPVSGLPRSGKKSASIVKVLPAVRPAGAARSRVSGSNHSHRSATSGSMRDALTAGPQHAVKAVTPTVITAAANVAKSVGFPATRQRRRGGLV